MDTNTSFFDALMEQHQWPQALSYALKWLDGYVHDTSQAEDNWLLRTLRHRIVALVNAMPDARDVLFHWRNGIDTATRYAHHSRAINMWLLLNDALNDNALSVAWARSIVKSSGAASLRRYDRWILSRALTATKQWDLQGLLYEAPAGQAAMIIWQAKEMAARMQTGPTSNNAQAGTRQEVVAAALGTVGRMYASLLACGRATEAQQVASLILHSEEASQGVICLVRAAIEAKVTAKEHRRWLEDLDATRKDVAECLAELGKG